MEIRKIKARGLYCSIVSNVTIIISAAYNPQSMTVPEFRDGYCITPEGLRFEAKSAEGGIPKNVWETYSAFANTDGGTVVFGLREEDGRLRVTGVRDPDNGISNLWNTLNNPGKVSCNLLSDSDIRKMDVGGCTLIVMDVPRASRRDRPVHLDGNPRNSFRRNGEGDYKCSADEVASMISDSLPDATDRVPIDTSEIGDLDAGTVKSYRVSFRTLRPDHPWNSVDDREFLRLLGAAVRDGDGYRPTLAGLLMFGRGYCITSEVYGYFLDYREYGSGDAGWSYRLESRSEDWSGNLYDFHRSVMNRVRLVSQRGFEIGEDLRRVESARMEVCMREALVNALVNADYRGRSGIAVEWRPESFSVRNPGTFRIPIPLAEEGGVSDPRNQTLAKMFSMLGDVERAGSGVRRIVDSCRENGLPEPVFTESYDPERVTVVVPLAARPGSGDIGEEVMRMIEEDGSVSLVSMASRLGVGKSVVVRAVDELRSKGLVSREGGTRGRWVVSRRG